MSRTLTHRASVIPTPTHAFEHVTFWITQTTMEINTETRVHTEIDGEPKELTLAETAVMVTLKRISQSPEIRYFIGPCSETFETLLEAAVVITGEAKDVLENRYGFCPQRCDRCGSNRGRLRRRSDDGLTYTVGCGDCDPGGEPFGDE